MAAILSGIAFRTTRISRGVAAGYFDLGGSAADLTIPDENLERHEG
jgi:hypothetical protein